MTNHTHTMDSHHAPIDTSAKTIAGGSIAEMIGGGGGLALSIIGLAGLLPFYMTAIAVLAIGAGLLLQGGAIAARYRSLQMEIAGGKKEEAELAGGMSIEMLGGIGGIVLGILALIGIVPAILLPTAAIVYGGTLLFGTGVNVPLRHEEAVVERPDVHQATQQSLNAATGIQVLAGLAGITLGILALVGPLTQLTLVLVALLCVSASTLASGGAFTARMASILTR